MAVARMVVWGTGLVAALATQYFKQEVRFARIEQTQIAETETLYLPPAHVLEVMALGYPSFAADLVHIKAYQDFVAHLYSDRVYRHLPRYIEVILALDPHINSVYHWASMAFKMGPTMTEEAVMQSIALAERGISEFPDDWRLYMDVGYDYYYELRPDDTEVWKRNRAIARDYFAMAAAIPGSRLDPAFVTQLFLDNNETQLALFHFYNLYLDATEEQRKDLLLRIRALEAEDAVATIERRDQQWKRDFPFIDRKFFEFVGPRTPTRLPLAWDELDELAAAAPPSPSGHAPPEEPR